MKPNHDSALEGDRITIVRELDAPRDLVFRNWIDADEVQGWFAPDGYEVTRCELDVRPGGAWRVELLSAAGERHAEFGVYQEISAPERIVFTLTQARLDGSGEQGPETTVTVTFAEGGGKTQMRFVQTGYAGASNREGNRAGWNECFGKLDRLTEVGELFRQWFADAAAKDLDAVMTKIADDVVSYEHDAPLVHRGADAVRAVCRQGFDAMSGEFRWSIPDLKVMVRHDIAVTWGLNRMQAQLPGQPGYESWSRGTRIFQRIDGNWKLIHQHVSFPYDPETGRAKTDLKPT